MLDRNRLRTLRIQVRNSVWGTSVAAFAMCGAAALVLHILGIGCPVKALTGVSCPGCGMTRAWLSLLALRLPEALSYHPLFWMPPVAFAVTLLDDGQRRWPRFALVVLLVALLAVWVARMGMPDDTSLIVRSTASGDVVNIGIPLWMRLLR